MGLDTRHWESLFPLTIEHHPYTVHLAKKDELNEVTSWYTDRSWMSLGFGIPEKDPQLNQELSHHLERCKQPGCHTLFIREGHTLVGFIHVVIKRHLQDTRATIGIILSPNHAGQGLGTLILDFVCDTLEQHIKTNSIALDTVDFNPRAIRCFEKCGFREVKRIQQPGFSQIYMIRRS